MNQKNTFLKWTRWLCNVLQWLYWLSVLIFGVGFFVSIFDPNWFMERLTAPVDPLYGDLSFSISIQGFNGNLVVSPLSIRLLLANSVITLSLMAMVFRNAYLIMKTAEGQTWFSKGNTPFQSNVVRMIKEMGIFLISVCGVNLLLSILLQGFGLSSDYYVEFSAFPIGCLLIALSIYFQYGVSLQEDVDGLI